MENAIVFVVGGVEEHTSARRVDLEAGYIVRQPADYKEREDESGRHGRLNSKLLETIACHLQTHRLDNSTFYY